MNELINKILTRGVEEIIPKEEFIENLKKNKNLRLKMGFYWIKKNYDPNARWSKPDKSRD